MARKCGWKGRAVFATTPWGRLRGIAGARRGDVVLLAPCRDVHTFGVDGALDIAFVDGQGRVVASYRDVGPQRRIRCSSAAAVMERWATQDTAWFEVGDNVGVASADVFHERDGERGADD